MIHRGLQLRPSIRANAVVILLTVLIGSPGVDLKMSRAQAPNPITPSGLGTQVSGPIAVGGQTQYDITGGTRPGGGVNLFHSFGEFGVPANNIANFLNETALPTSNILGRVTGGNISNIFGTIQTTGYGNANLFLMNPTGFLIGPNATVNVGGMVTFTSAEYLKLTDSVKFNAIPNAAADALLTASPVAAFGFLGSIPQAISFEGGRLTVANGTGITLVGGDINLVPDPISGAPSSITAQGRQIQMTSVSGPGEVVVDMGMPVPGIIGGSINLGPGTLLDVSGNAAGTVRIQSGSFVMDNATISADSIDAKGAPVAIDINVTDNVSISTIDVPALTARTTGTGNAGEITISSGSMDVTSTTGESFFFSAIDTHTSGPGNAGNVTINTGNLTVTGDPLTGSTLFIDSGTSGPAPGRGGDVSITAETIDLKNTLISTGNLIAFFMDEGGAGTAGNVTITADRLQMTLSQIVTDSNDFIHPTGTSGDITITARDLNFDASGLSTTGNERSGAVTITADQFVATESQIQAITNLTPGGDVKITGNVIEFRNGSNIASSTMGDGDAGPIIITATNHLGFLDSSPGGRPSGIFNNSFGENGSLGKAGDVVITTPSLQLTGGARINTTTATSGEGGNVTITANNSISMSGENSGFEVEPLFNLGTTQSSGIYTRTIGGHCIGPCGNAGDITIQTGSLSLGSGSQTNSGTTSNGRGGNISITASDTIGISGTLSTGQPGGIQSRTIGLEPDAGAGGNIALSAGQSVTISDGASVSASSTGSGNAGNITIQGLASPAESVLIDGPGSGIFTDTQGSGAGGNIFVNANSVTLQSGGTLSAQTAGSGNAGNIAVMASSFSMSDRALISAGTDGGTTGHGGNISIQADEVLLTDNAGIATNTLGSGDAGTIAITTQDRISLTDSRMNSSTFAFPGKPEGGQGGQITLHAPTIDISNGEIVSLSQSSGNAGNVLLETARLTLDASRLEASASGSGNGGDITIRGLTAAGSSSRQVALMGASQVLSETANIGNGGTIAIQTAQLMMQDNILISTSSQGEGTVGNAGNVTLNASQSLRVTSGSLVQSGSFALSEGNAGNITVTAPAITLDAGTISTTTEFAGSAGTVMIKTNSLTVQNGGQIASSSVIVDEIPTGSAGSITIQGLTSPAQSVLIDGLGSGVFSDTQGTGAGGNIFVDANTVTLQNGGTLSAKTSGTEPTATGGTIAVTATDTLAMTSGASMSASSSGLGDAGNIDITATNGLTMQNSTIMTQSGQEASGGNIKVTTSPEATVLLQNSLISASVADGPGGGGNISIDPQYVILLNSQILAQAAQGQGGAITITANLFLPDANSIVNADSGKPGLNGTVTIQSPNAPASGKIQPLGKTPLQATSLLNQHCASLAGGEFSSFTVAGRDSLPAEPGSWLASPLALGTLSAGTGLAERGEGLEGITLGASLAGETPLLSLRQIAPPGFLSQAFAVDQTGCTS